MRGWRHLWVCVALGACSLSGCVRVWTTYTPAKAEFANGAPQAVPLATVAYEDDVPALMAAGGVVLGRIEGSGNGYAGQDDVRERIRAEGARLGATHVIFAKAYAVPDRTPDVYQTNCSKGVCTTTNVGGIRYSRPHAGYVLIRVPETGLAMLPAPLRVSAVSEEPGSDTLPVQP